MTTVQQQLDFIQHVRDSYDNEQRELIVVKYPAEMVGELLRDIHENIIAVRNWQLGHEPNFCSDCNQALTPHNRVNFAVAEGQIIVGRGDHVCERCTTARAERLKNNSTIGIP